MYKVVTYKIISSESESRDDAVIGSFPTLDEAMLFVIEFSKQNTCYPVQLSSNGGLSVISCFIKNEKPYGIGIACPIDLKS